MSSMKGRACVKVTDFGKLDAWPSAAARAVAAALQSSIRPRGAGQCRAGLGGSSKMAAAL